MIENFEKLSNKDVNFYLTEIQKGNTEARNKLLFHYAWNIIEIINKDFSNSQYSKEDLFQVGFIGALDALNNYSNKKRSVFYNRIHQKIIKEIQSYINSENKNTFEKDIIEQENIIEDKENIILIYEYIKTLSDKEKQIINLYFYENYSFAEISTMLNVSRQRIEQILTCSIFYIKKQIILSEINFDNNIYVLENLKDQLNYKYNEDIIDFIDNQSNDKYILKIINNLSETKRNIMILYLYGNYSIKQISKLCYMKYNDTKKAFDKGLLYIKQYIFFNLIDYNQKTQKINKHENKKDKIDVISYTRNNPVVIFKAIKNLPSQKRSIMYLYLYENYRIEDIANFYNLSKENIKSMIDENKLLIEQYITNNMNFSLNRNKTTERNKKIKIKKYLDQKYTLLKNNKYSFNIISSNNENISFENLLENSTLEELKLIKEFIEIFIKNKNKFGDPYNSTTISSKNNTLKLEIKK